jgi:D-3-phosphoglycerate dehydrogenase
LRVFVADPLNREAVEILARAGLEVLEQADIAGGQLAAALRDTDALIVRGRTRVTAEVLAGGSSLRAVCRAGSGVDNIDVAAARTRGVAVFNTPGANAISVAELAWGMALALARHLVPAAVSTAQGGWEKSRFEGREWSGRTVGVIGLGQIGRRVASYARAFGCRVLGHDPLVPPPDGVLAVDLETLLAESHLVTLHVPLTEETRHLLDRRRLESMRRGASLVNCARGGLVDEAALYDLLVSGHLAGAGLDVFAEEPPRDRRLTALPQVVATPHVGAATAEAQRRAGVAAAEIVRDFLLAGDAPGRVA